MKMKTFYQSCMDVEAIEKQGTGPLWDLLERLGGWPVLMGDEWRPQGSFSLVHIHKALIDLGLLDDMVVSLTVAPHDKDNSRNALGVSLSLLVSCSHLTFDLRYHTPRLECWTGNLW